MKWKAVMQMSLLLNECHARLLADHRKIPDCQVPSPGHSQGLNMGLRELPAARHDAEVRQVHLEGL